jgi:hypothetical protein
MKIIHTTFLLILSGCSIAYAMQEKGKTLLTPPPQKIAPVVVTCGALPGADSTATLKRRNPQPQTNALGRSPEFLDLPAVEPKTRNPIPKTHLFQREDDRDDLQALNPIIRIK